MSNKYDRHYPAIPLRNVTVFPGMVMHFDVSRKKSVKAVEASMAADELIYLVTQRFAGERTRDSRFIYSRNNC